MSYSKFFLPTWILDLWYPGHCYLMQEVLVLHLFVCIQSFVHKNKMKSAQFCRCLWPSDNFPLNCIVTEVLVCPILALHEFIILENSIGFLYSGLVFLSFVPVFIFVASQFVLIICTHLCPSTLRLLHHLSSRMLTALFTSGWLPILGWVKCLLALVVWRTLSPFCLAMFQLISHYYKSWLYRHDDSGLSICLKVIILHPPTSTPLHLANITRYCPTYHSHQHSMTCYFP